MEGRRKGVEYCFGHPGPGIYLWLGRAQSANYHEHGQVEMVQQPSGQATDWSLYEEMEGGR
jgi:hypothetical protein